MANDLVAEPQTAWANVDAPDCNKKVTALPVTAVEVLTTVRVEHVTREGKVASHVYVTVR